MNKHVSLVGVFLLTIIALSTSLFFNACKKDKSCPSGYEGSNCEIESRTKFLGNWKTFESCNGSSSTSEYSIEITPSTSSVASVEIQGFAGAIDVPATIDGNGFTIPQGSYDGVDASGTGSISSDGKTITINYTASDIFNSFTCTGTWTKQ